MVLQVTSQCRRLPHGVGSYLTVLKVAYWAVLSGIYYCCPEYIIVHRNIIVLRNIINFRGLMSEGWCTPGNIVLPRLPISLIILPVLPGYTTVPTRYRSPHCTPGVPRSASANGPLGSVRQGIFGWDSFLDNRRKFMLVTAYI